jgi:energy-coupling factor transport system permease protein
MPVLEGSLERAVDLAAAMDSRGYGRTADVPARDRRRASLLLLGGLLGLAVGVYGLLDSAGDAYGLPLLVLGAAAAGAGLALSGRRSVRTRYRPDPWSLPEWIVAASGVLPAVVLVVVSLHDPGALVGTTSPPSWPGLPLPPALAIACAAIAGVVAPLPPGRLMPLRAAGAADDDIDDGRRVEVAA